MNKLIIDASTGMHITVPMTEAEIAARQADEARPDLIRIMYFAREQMSAILNSMSVADKFLLFKTRIAVEEALDRGEYELARYMVEQQEVPERLLDTKQQILDLFPV